MKSDIYKKNYNSIVEKANLFRFRAIESAIQIEAILSENLIDFLSNESTRKSIEKHLFSDAVTFDRKVILFNSFNKLHLFKPTAENTTLNNDLIYIQKLRNYMAHSVLNTTEEAVMAYNEREISFISFTEKGKKEVIVQFYEKTDNPEKLIFSYNVLVDKYNRASDNLTSIQHWLKSME